MTGTKGKVCRKEMKRAIYKGLECKILFDYKNGNYEILFIDNVILVCDTDLHLEILTNN
jgi:hypothetical protein